MMDTGSCTALGEQQLLLSHHLMRIEDLPTEHQLVHISEGQGDNSGDHPSY